MDALHTNIVTALAELREARRTGHQVRVAHMQARLDWLLDRLARL